MKSPTALIAPLFVEVVWLAVVDEEPTVNDAGMVIWGLTTELRLREVVPEAVVIEAV